jgi:hypothetical protein
MFIVALFTIAKLWNQYRCPSTHEWSVSQPLKRTKIMLFSGKWMEMEIIMLSKIMQTPLKSIMFSFICGS